MRIIKTTLLCAAIGLAVTAAGCGEKRAAPGSAASPSAAVSPKPSTPAATEPAGKQAMVQAYYADPDATKLVLRSVSIRYDQEEGKYLAALRALTASPSADAVSLCPNTTFRSAKLVSGTLTVDLSLPDEDRLGSGGEALLLDALKKTLFQFEEVQAVELLVDGKKTESLMGHLELQHPFKRGAK